MCDTAGRGWGLALSFHNRISHFPSISKKLSQQTSVPSLCSHKSLGLRVNDCAGWLVFLVFALEQNDLGKWLSWEKCLLISSLVFVISFRNWSRVSWYMLKNFHRLISSPLSRCEILSCTANHTTKRNIVLKGFSPSIALKEIHTRGPTYPQPMFLSTPLYSTSLSTSGVPNPRARDQYQSVVC